VGSYGVAYHGLSLADGAAFIRAEAINLAHYTGGQLQLIVTDPNGVTVEGYIADADVDEALGSELVTDGIFSDWTGGDLTSWTEATSVDASSHAGRIGGISAEITHVRPAPAGILQPFSVTAGKLYKFEGYGQADGAGDQYRFLLYDLTQTLNIWVQPNQTNTAWALSSAYFTAESGTSTVRIYFEAIGSGDVCRVDDVTVKEVTDVGSDGVHIVNAKGGATQNWETINSGFDYNASSYSLTAQGSEAITVYRGHLKDVRYTEKKCQPHMRDKMWDFTRRIVGESDNAVIGSDTNPALLAWNLCTSYGGLDSTADSSNPDVNYELWNAWSQQFSDDSVTMGFNYTGEKVIEALNSIAKMTDSAIWIEGDGKLSFQKFVTPSSLDATLTRDEFERIRIDVQSTKLVNKQWVFGDYAIGSEYWQIAVFDESSISVDSFGTFEEALQDETCWFETSADATVLAQRLTLRYRLPPKKFVLTAALQGAHRQIAETMRLVDSFYNISSADGFRIMEYSLDMDNGGVEFVMDNTAALNAFYLDVSTLDGTDLLL
jgi:hypothetical protein